jgi:hypothetical protein
VRHSVCPSVCPSVRPLELLMMHCYCTIRIHSIESHPCTHSLTRSLHGRSDGSNPAFKPDWSEWATVDRTEVQDAAGMGKQKAEDAKETFDPRIIGECCDYI